MSGHSTFRRSGWRELWQELFSNLQALLSSTRLRRQSTVARAPAVALAPRPQLRRPRLTRSLWNLASPRGTETPPAYTSSSSPLLPYHRICRSQWGPRTVHAQTVVLTYVELVPPTEDKAVAAPSRARGLANGNSELEIIQTTRSSSLLALY